MPRVYNHEAGHDAEILPTLRGYQSLLDRASYLPSG
jgi:hypothetical protein